MLARRAWEVMGTWVSLVIGDEDQVDSAADAAREVLADVDRRFSSYRADSEVSRFNRGEVRTPSPELAEVLAACSWLGSQSGGVFTTFPDGPDGNVDVAGFVKGWAVDLAAQSLDELGVAHFALGVGGDWFVRGGHPEGRPWRLAILDPNDRTRPRATVALYDGALATSGTYERGQHIVIPQHDGIRALSQPGSFSVAGPQARWADAFATVGYAMGDEGLGWVGQYAGYHAAIIAAAGTMTVADGFPVAADARFPELSFPYQALGPHA